MKGLSIETAFGQVIKELRKERKLSQEQLSYDSYLDRSYISQLEHGRKQPTILTIFQLADALKVKPSVIIAEVERLSGLT